MAYISRYIYTTLATTYEDYKDPRTVHLPLVGSPVPMAISIAVYLGFVLHYGPKWMENRKPYNLKYIMRIYNAIQVIANFVLLLYGAKWSYLRKEFSFACQPVDHTNTAHYMRGLIYVSYGYYITKYLDLFDTVFFILRKKNNQITFLHVYHHAGMVFAVYVFMTFLAGSHSTMLGVINLLVHTVMYAYYFITSLRPIKRALWWKRHITQLQLLQFGYLMLHFLLVLVHNPCQHPPLIAFVGFSQNLFMFLLFFDFYYKAYVKKSTAPNATPSSSSAVHQRNLTATKDKDDEHDDDEVTTATDVTTKFKAQTTLKRHNLHNSPVMMTTMTMSTKTSTTNSKFD